MTWSFAESSGADGLASPDRIHRVCILNLTVILVIFRPRQAKQRKGFKGVKLPAYKSGLENACRQSVCRMQLCSQFSRNSMVASMLSRDFIFTFPLASFSIAGYADRHAYYTEKYCPDICMRQQGLAGYCNNRMCFLSFSSGCCFFFTAFDYRMPSEE